jgi:hypothetical protein
MCLKLRLFDHLLEEEVSGGCSIPYKMRRADYQTALAPVIAANWH